MINKKSNVTFKNKTKKSIRIDIDKKCDNLNIQEIIKHNFINNQIKNSKYSKNNDTS